MRKLTEEEYREAEREYWSYCRGWEWAYAQADAEGNAAEWVLANPWLDIIPWLETQGVYLCQE